MSESTQATFVARESDLATLRTHFEGALTRTCTTVHLTSPVGGGKRALVGDFVSKLGDQSTEVLTWRSNLTDEEDGLRVILRLYASLYSALYRDPLLKSRVEMVLNAQVPQQTPRVQAWYKTFVDALRQPAPKSGDETFKVMLPRDNPALGLVEILAGISRKMPVIFDIQNLHFSHSLSTFALLEAILERCKGCQLLMILGTEPVDEVRSAWMPSPMLDFLERRSEEIANLPLAPWTTEDVAAFLKARSLAGDAEEIARIGQGRPAFVAELVEVLRSQDRLEDSLAGESLASLAPMALTEGELDPDAYPDTKRKVAGAEDIQEMAYRAALLGRGFPSGLLADIGGYDRESVDDLLDAAPDLFKEVQFSQPMQTWIYQFQKGIWRQGALDAYLQDPAKAAEGKEIGRRTALFLERFLVPQAYEFVVKTARLNAEVGELDRARMLRSMALSSGRPEIWAITRDLLKSLDEVAWPDPMRRTVYMNLLDRMVQVGDVKQADDLYNEALAWGSEKSDRSMEAWLLFAGSRLDYRRQDLYRARDRAQDAATMYKALDDSRKQAEVETHLGLIELADGQLEKALEHVDKALELGSVKTPEGVRVLPQVAAQAEMVRGMAAKQGQKFKEAAGHFQKANEISGSTGQASVALESGLAYGEALILSGKAAQAIDVLRRVGMIAQSLKNPMRQRAASALLGQAQGGLKKYQDALKSAQATLELTRQLKLSNLEPIDLYNVGFFQLMLGNPQDALVMFRQSKNMANLSRDVLFTKELLFNTGLAAARSGDMDAALETFDAALPAVRQAKDHAKLAATCEQLANLVVEKGDKIRAVALLEEGISAAEQANLPEQQETMNRKLAELQA